MEISGITHFILKRGATVFDLICGKHYQGSPLVQSWPNVPPQVTVCISVSVVNHVLLSRYKMLLRNRSFEPKDEPMRVAEQSQL